MAVEEIQGRLASRRISRSVFFLTGILLASILALAVDRFLASSTRYPNVFVKAMSTSVGTPKQHRILCYGDSLTAGTSGYELYPYAPRLEAFLKERGADVMVRHRGLPGWTAKYMLNDVDGERTGLRAAIQAVKDPPLSLVILLAGTNDLGMRFSAEEIAHNVLGLHRVALDLGVPRTIAIGIPPSGYQSVNEEARAKAAQVDAQLQEKLDARTTFMPFPFAFESGGKNWDRDTLHFSPEGYRSLAVSLVPVVECVLLGL